MASKKDYFGLSRLASIILAIIPFTSWILGILTRFEEKKYRFYNKCWGVNKKHSNIFVFK